MGGREGNSLDRWLATQTAQSAQAMMANIGPSTELPGASAGAVVASPSHVPDYRYAWVRDGALTLDTVLGLYRRATLPTEREKYLKTLLEYADFSRGNQLTGNPSGEADGMGLGEPKYNVDGTAFTGLWGRPQNDGPALRASTLIRLAQTLLDQGREDLVRQKLYAAILPARTVIKSDLEYVSHHWQDSSYDLWEEVRGAHFYTEMVQRRALLEGAALADRLGDPGAASFYRSQAQALEPLISSHWDGAKGMIVATRDWVEGRRDKTSGLDVAVVLGALHGAARSGQPVDPFFAITDDRVLATAQKVEEAFHRIYWVNTRDKDSEGLALGSAIGRYPEDKYSGNGPVELGNPWFLATDAFAELYYGLARAFEKQGSLKINEVNSAFFRKLKTPLRLGALRAGEQLQAGQDTRFAVILQGLRDAGDAYLRRVKFHSDPHGALSEQFNRDTGYMMSAGQLTWSHASLLTAAWARQGH